MEDVAGEAGVAVQTVYYIFGTKGRLLCDAMEFAAAAAHDPGPVQGRAWMIEALNAPSAPRSLAVAVEHGTDIYQRAAPLWPAVSSAAIADTAVAEYWDGVTAGRRTGMRQLVGHLAQIEGLRDGLDVEMATDIVFSLNSHPVFQSLVVEAGWDLPRFKGWLYTTLCAQILASDVSDPSATVGFEFDRWPPG